MLSKEWLKHQLGHRTTAKIDSYCGRWIREDALNMADQVAKRLIWEAPRDTDFIARFQLATKVIKSSESVQPV